MVDELTGKEAWGPLLAANLAKDSSTGAKHICVSMWSLLLRYQHGRRWIINSLHGFNFSSPVEFLEVDKKTLNVVAMHQKFAKHCKY